MSQTREILFVVSYQVDRGSWTPGEWRVRARRSVPGMGTPNAVNLKAHVAFVEASTQPGGVNAHLGATKILSAKIVDQWSGETVATFQAE